MKESIYERQKLKSAHRIDNELILCIEKAMTECESDAKIEVIVNCKNNTELSFPNVGEFINYSKSHVMAIDKLLLKITLSTAGSICIELANCSQPTESEIVYRMNIYDTYMIIKKKINELFDNNVLSYSILCRIPILFIICTIAFITICIYTYINRIIFPSWLQSIIWVLWSLSIWTAIIPFFSNRKGLIFPSNDFLLGTNTTSSKRAQSLRNLLGKGLILALFTGIVSSIIVNIFLS